MKIFKLRWVILLQGKKTNIRKLDLKVLHINTSLLTDAPGRIADDIGKMLIAHGHKPFIGYGRATRTITSTPVKIGTPFDQAAHLILTRLFDRHGFF